MVNLTIYLDCRRAKSDGTYPLKLSVSFMRQTRQVSLGLYVSNMLWDASSCSVSPKHPNCRLLNSRIAEYRLKAERALLELDMGENENLTLSDYIACVKRAITGQESKPKNPQRFAGWLIEFASSGGKKESTRDLYFFTLSRMSAFDPKIKGRTFEDIDLGWLERFEAFCAKTAGKNARNIHLRNIRAVFNNAIDHGITTVYPFRRFKIRPEATRKRSLTVDELRRLFIYPVEDYAEIYRDMFKLIFMLIGINTIDLHGLKGIENGRIEYRRAKTNRLYSIKVEPEAMALIEKYRGVDGLLCIADRWADSRNFRHQCNKALQRFGSLERKGRGGRKIIVSEWPELTTYWARHSWATIASSLDIPKDTIAAALGHGGKTVTDIYIDFDQHKVDEANRRVLNWVLYGKR